MVIPLMICVHLSSFAVSPFASLQMKKATEFQRKAMSRMYRGKEIFKPLNTGWIDENVACVREWVEIGRAHV